MRANTTPGPRILIVDDDPVMRRTLGDTLTRAGFEVAPAATVAEALRLAADAEPALAILDLVLPDGDGIELLGSLRATWPALPAIVVTAYVEPRSVVEAMRRGALDYLGKPIDPEMLLSACRAALARRPAPVTVTGKAVELPIVGVSAEIARIRETLTRLARTRPAGLLIAGPAGSGKTWLAQVLHGASPRAQAPCVVYRCVEAYAPMTALFGTPGVSGSGLLAATQGGTLILDDVDRLEREVQVALLERADRQRATGAPLLVGLTEAERADGPLVAWLSRVRLDVPALADRTADVIPLARHFLAEAARRLGKTIPGFTTDAEHRLLAHAWPGNIRELREVVERAAAAGVGAIRPELLVLGGTATAPAWFPTGPPRPLREIEDAYIDHVIALSGGNKTRAAQLLGIARETLRTRMLSRGNPGVSGEERSA
ncbi:MAG TPA: response regulator [Methylomirabilota bacterium]|nr:response regulator [Methylomirabilota bacterium]